MRTRWTLLVTVAGLTAAMLPAQARPVTRASATPPMPAATYQTVSQWLQIEMNDHVHLGATITFPSKDGATPAPGRFPVVFSMTPYGRDGVCGCPSQTEYPSRGIISAVVDTRGTGGSEGTLDDNYFSPREQRDGHDLVEWFARQPWSTGRIGMIGGSYLGITQYLTAETQPPHLVAIAPDVALSDVYRDAYTYDGVPDFFFDTQYNGVQGGPGIASGNIGIGATSGAGNSFSPDDVTTTATAKAQQAQSKPVALDYLERPNDDAWYHDRSPYYRVGKISIPVLIIDGWRDGAFVRGAFEMYQHLAKRRGVETRIDVNACTHKGCGAPFDPMHDANGYDDFPSVEFDFMSHYLRGTPEHPTAPVSFDLQPAGPYVQADQWPPRGTQLTKYFLGGADGPLQPASGLAAAGALTKAAPKIRTTASYVTDPAAGASMTLDSYGTIAISPYVPLDQRLEEEQGLTWRTAADPEPTVLTGPLQLHLVASSSATETDWVARLSDVAPDGTESVVTEGALRASHRQLDPRRSTPGSPYHLESAPQPLVPNRVYDFDVALIATGYRVAPGHSLQLRLTTDDLPTRLPATIALNSASPGDSSIEPLSPATNTVVQGGPDPSWLLLPLQPA